MNLTAAAILANFSFQLHTLVTDTVDTVFIHIRRYSTVYV